MENNPNPNQDEDIKKRVCKDCNKIKSLLEFPQNRNNKTQVSYRHRCKDCEKVIKKEQNKKYYDKKKQKEKKQTD